MTNETPVSLLNQVCSKNDIVPSYNLIAREGRVHAPVFTYKVELEGINVEGSGQSKKKAKHVAAKLMLKALLHGDSVMLDVLEQEAIRRCLKACDEEDIAEAKMLANAFQNAIKGQNRDAITGPEGRSDDKLGMHDDQSGGLMYSDLTDDMNPIGKLQEICMKKFWNPPVYEDKSVQGEPHERLFYVECIIENMNLRQKGSGKSKKLAKRQAAQEMIKKLRRENLDRVDELLDRLPKTNSRFSSFDIINQLVNHRKKRGCAGAQYIEQLNAAFIEDIKKDEEKWSDLCGMFANNMLSYMVDYMNEDTIIPDIEMLMSRIEELLSVHLDMSTFAEKRHDESFQCIGELIANDPKYESAIIVSSFGSDTDLSKTKQKTMTRCIVVLLMFLVN